MANSYLEDDLINAQLETEASKKLLFDNLTTLANTLTTTFKRINILLVQAEPKN